MDTENYYSDFYHWSGGQGHWFHDPLLRPQKGSAGLDIDSLLLLVGEMDPAFYW